MYMDELATIHKTSDGQHVLAVRPPKKKDTKGGDAVSVSPDDPKTYVAANSEELHGLIDEHVYGKKKTKEEKFDKGWKTPE